MLFVGQDGSERVIHTGRQRQRIIRDAPAKRRLRDLVVLYLQKLGFTSYDIADVAEAFADGGRDPSLFRHRSVPAEAFATREAEKRGLCEPG